MKRKTVTDLAHNLLLSNINKESVIVDATAGNGHDTLFLAQHVKHVHAFDIQLQAINNSKELTKDYSNITFHHTSFENITKITPYYDGVIFNLGYLPGSDKQIKTNYHTTIQTLDKLHEKKMGFIEIVAYPGHIEGFIESVAIQSWLDKNKIKYRVIKLPFDTKNEPPFIFYWNYKD
ncbi:tRNA (mnm(5)s(2)U34)-methyltransferase [Acholeplasma hippikon]|nr:class I SAM-dependent methyltransferase [Acholeplasma hippikon]